MVDDKYMLFLKQLLTQDLGLDGAEILNASTRLNKVLNKVPYKLKYLRKQNRPMAKYLEPVLKRLGGVILRYQKAVEKKKAKPLGFLKRRTLENFRIKFQSALRNLK